ncbi:MAG TPA: hypothetical protein VF772_21005 [Terriglobales bacterium]
MVEETLHHRGTTLVRRLILSPGEATRWHIDLFPRVSVVVKSEALSIEFRDGGPTVRVAVTPGQVDWDEPGDRIHRAEGMHTSLAVLCAGLIRWYGFVPHPLRTCQMATAKNRQEATL